jgi:hypothetical protein
MDHFHLHLIVDSHYLPQYSTHNCCHLRNHRARSIAATTTTTQRRTMAKESRAHLYTGFPTNMDQLRNNIWLSDPGAYPVIVVLSGAVVFAGSFIAYCALRNPDVRITFGRRQQLVRTWE